MRCKYCFYIDEGKHREKENTEIMTTDTADALIEAAFAQSPRHGITFAFQGGEPTLAGIEYFRHFVGKVATINNKHVPVQYAIQTNGLALDKEWADFFYKNKFLIGISTDGYKFLHDTLRVDINGSGTWDLVAKKLNLLLENKVDTNLLCVVTRQCAKKPEKIYKSLKELGIKFIQFIPCLDPLEVPRGSMVYSLLPEQYGYFLCGIFDAWYKDYCEGNYTSVRLFDDYVHLAMGMPPGTCSTSGSCGSYIVVEGDGSVYPCDFYCLDGWSMGNINDVSMDYLYENETRSKFLNESLKHPPECKACRYKTLCNGGCKRDWYVDPDGTNHNYFCSSFKTFFEYSYDRILQVARNQIR